MEQLIQTCHKNKNVRRKRDLSDLVFFALKILYLSFKSRPVIGVSSTPTRPGVHRCMVAPREALMTYHLFCSYNGEYKCYVECITQTLVVYFQNFDAFQEKTNTFLTPNILYSFSVGCPGYLFLAQSTLFLQTQWSLWPACHSG